MNEQLTIWDIPQITESSKCLNCYWECKGKCACWHSRYEDMDIPIKGCDWFDGLSGGIPGYKELEGRFK